MGPPRTLVLITVDCLRADHTGFLGYDRPTTPFLDSLAQDAYVFSNAIVAGAPTYYSFPAIMASRYPLALGRDVTGLAPGEPTLATSLKDAGYSTAAFLAGNPYLSHAFGYDDGFRTFSDGLVADELETGPAAQPGLLSRVNRAAAALSHKLGPVGKAYDEAYFQYCQRVVASGVSSMTNLRRFPGADTIVDQALAWVRSTIGRPIFLWLHLMDPHSPYYPPEAAMEMMGAESTSAWQARYLNSYWHRHDVDERQLHRHRDEVVKLYDAGIRWADSQIARLVDTLREMGLWENSVFALTADHGEEFLEHGGRYHSPSQVSEEVIRVPLLVRVPGANGKKTIANPFSLLHLAPTLLDAVAVPVPSSFQGLSRWERLEQAAIADENAIVESVGHCTNPFRRGNRTRARTLVVRGSRYKLVVDFERSTENVFDLKNDPGELHPLPVDAEKNIRRQLLDRARQHLAAVSGAGNPDRRASALLRDLRLEWTNSVTQISS